MAAAQAVQAEPELRVQLPDGVDWVQVTDRSDETGYIREWIPAGTEPESADWIISTQKLPLKGRTKAKAFARSLMSAAKGACTHTLYNGPERMPLNGHDAFVLRTMCAQQKGTQRGAFIDQRVIVIGSSAYVLTSELRTAPSERAGVLAFPPGTEASDVMQFVGRIEESATLVRTGVTFRAPVASD